MGDHFKADENRDPNAKTLNMRGFINHGSTLNPGTPNLSMGSTGRESAASES